jgi:ABC-type multidrug transport system fused ATPase/permease subunit
VAYLTLSVGGQAIALCQPLAIGALLNRVQTDPRWGAIWPMLVLLLAMELGFWLFHFPARISERQLAFHLRIAFREELTRAVCELPMKWHRANHSGETIDKVNRASQAIFEFGQSTFQIVSMLMKVVGPLVLLFVLAPVAGFAAIATAGLAVAIILLFDRVLFEQYRDVNRKENSVAAAVQDYFGNIMTVVTLRLSERVIGEVVRRSSASWPTLRSNFRMNETKWSLVSTLIEVMAAAVVGAHAYATLAAGGVLLAGTFFKLFEYLRRVGDSFFQLASIWGVTLRQAADVYGAVPIVEAHTALVRADVRERLPEGWRTLEVSRLDFTYEDEKKRTHHLRDISLTLDRGKAVALVGASGSGKSTLLAVLRGLHQAHGAQVRCDGQSVSGGLHALSRTTTLFPQEPEIFSDSVRFNVAFGFAASDAEVLQALERACFSPVLERLPSGLDTNVAERGVNLSGGERQRLALARGLFFADKSDVLLLDEATSSVDALNEQRIFASLKARCADRCLIATIHKLHLLSFFDVVYFIDDGRIIDGGTPAELKQRAPAFRRLWEASVADPG